MREFTPDAVQPPQRSLRERLTGSASASCFASDGGELPAEVGDRAYLHLLDLFSRPIQICRDDRRIRSRRLVRVGQSPIPSPLLRYRHNSAGACEGIGASFAGTPLRRGDVTGQRRSPQIELGFDLRFDPLSPTPPVIARTLATGKATDIATNPR